MSLIADSTQKKPGKEKKTKEEIITLLKSQSNLMEEQEDMEEYINSLDWNSGQEVNNLREGFEQFRIEKNEKQLAAIAHKNGLELTDLKNFVNTILSRMIFDGEKLTDLLEPLDLGWKDRKQKELELMKDLLPELLKLAQGREIAGLNAYE